METISTQLTFWKVRIALHKAGERLRGCGAAHTPLETSNPATPKYTDWEQGHPGQESQVGANEKHTLKTATYLGQGEAVWQSH